MNKYLTEISKEPSSYVGLGGVFMGLSQIFGGDLTNIFRQASEIAEQAGGAVAQSGDPLTGFLVMGLGALAIFRRERGTSEDERKK